MRITAARVELGIGVSPISVAEATWTS